MKLKQNNRGDTIVEVMIVLAVLGLAIGISYATANRSLLNARQAQENSQATELAQSQVEALRRLSSSTSPDIFQPGSFCLVPTADPVNPYTKRATAVANQAPCTAAGSVPYWTSVTYSNAVAAPDTFTVQVTWPDVLGQGNDTVTLVYRVHKP